MEGKGREKTEQRKLENHIPLLKEMEMLAKRKVTGKHFFVLSETQLHCVLIPIQVLSSSFPSDRLRGRSESVLLGLGGQVNEVVQQGLLPGAAGRVRAALARGVTEVTASQCPNSKRVWG